MNQLQLVAMKLSAEVSDHEDDDEDGYGIWPAQKEVKPLPGKLPDDLLFQLILVRLPLLRLLDLRSVSCSWRCYLSSRDFWSLWFRFNPNPKSSPNASTCRSSPIPIPNPTVNPYPQGDQIFELLMSQHDSHPNPSPWSRRPFPLLLICSGFSLAGFALQWVKQRFIRYARENKETQTHRPWFRLHENFLQVDEPYTILACEGGLLLLAQHSSEAQQLIVCNPLLRSHKLLPNPIFHHVKDITITGFIVDVDLNEYTVILSDVSCQVYCSKDTKWKLISENFFEDAVSVYPPMLDGSFFWLSQKPNASNFCTLSAYHATQEVVTSLRMQYPHGITSLKCGHIWKDSMGLFTLAVRFQHLTVWRLDVWQREQEKYVPNLWNLLRPSPLVSFKYVKAGNLIFLRGVCNQIYISTLDLKRGCSTPPCPVMWSRVDFHVFQPSYILV